MRQVVVATPDPPPSGVPNPVHGDEGAAAAGYRGALVAGVRTYGWVAEVIVAAAGARWLEDGWADFTLHRPLFSGEAVTIDVEPVPPGPGAGAGAGATFSLRAAAGGEDTATGQPDGAGGASRVVLDGSAGTGTAPWAGEIDPPPPGPASEAPPVRPSYQLDGVPRRRPLRPLGAFISATAARKLATDELSQTTSAVPDGMVHPWFLAGRMAPLTRHNFTYGPTIHVRSQIQHLAPARVAHQFVINAWIVDAWERNEHWYQQLDGSIVDDEGVEVARLRHTTIFRPRGTTLPTVP